MHAVFRYVPGVSLNQALADLQMVRTADPDGANKCVQAAKVIGKQGLTVSQELRVFCMLPALQCVMIVCLLLLLCDSCYPGSSTSCVAHCYCAPCATCSVARLTLSLLLKEARVKHAALSGCKCASSCTSWLGNAWAGLAVSAPSRKGSW